MCPLHFWWVFCVIRCVYFYFLLCLFTVVLMVLCPYFLFRVLPFSFLEGVIIFLLVLGTFVFSV